MTTPSPDRPGGVSMWRRWLNRITASNEELDAAELHEASQRVGGEPVTACRHGQEVTVSGRLVTVTSTPKTTSPILEAELFDGTGTVTLIWLGRRPIPGIEPGRGVIAVGRIAIDDGRKVIYNPHYTLEPTAS